MFKNLAALIFLVVSFNAYAWTWNTNRVLITLVEASYLPSLITFQTNTVVGECSGGWFTWVPRGATDSAKVDNSKAVLGTLLAALSSDTMVNLYGSGCNVEYIHMTK